MSELLFSGGEGGAILLLAHGAGAPMTSPFMELIAASLAERGLASARFEFAYMAQRRTGGKRRPPPRAEALLSEYQTAIAAVASRWPGHRVLIGGKSMGGRVASMLADGAYTEGRCSGLVCLGYPFHPTHKPTQLRTAHLASLICPALIVQGERDPFGTRAEVAAYPLSPAIAMAWLPDGDHDFGPRRGSGHTRKGNLAMAADAIVRFAMRP